MRENVRSFLNKAEADPGLAKKLEQAKQDYIRGVVSLAREAGVSLTEEDFSAETMPLSDGEVSEVTGGIRLPNQPLIKDDKFIPFGKY